MGVKDQNSILFYESRHFPQFTEADIGLYEKSYRETGPIDPNHVLVEKKNRGPSSRLMIFFRMHIVAAFREGDSALVVDTSGESDRYDKEAYQFLINNTWGIKKVDILTKDFQCGKQTCTILARRLLEMWDVSLSKSLEEFKNRILSLEDLS